jgi:Flp pilus assembly protein TadD
MNVSAVLSVSNLRRAPRQLVSAALVLALAACAQRPETFTQANAPSGAVGPNTLNVADAAIAGGDPNMALSISQSILKDDPNNVDALVHEGDAYYALNRCLPAEAAYQNAIKYDSKSSPAETGLGRCLLKTDPAAAEQAFAAAVAADPGNAAAWSDLGISRDLQGKFRDAVEPYQKSLSINPGSIATEVNLGLSLALSGHGQEALQYLGPLATGKYATPKIRENYAAALIAAGRDAEARQVLEIDLPPDQVQKAMDGFSQLISSSIQNPPPPKPPAPTQPTVVTPPVATTSVFTPAPTTLAPAKPATMNAPVSSNPNAAYAGPSPIPGAISSSTPGPVAFAAQTIPKPTLSVSAAPVPTSKSGGSAIQLGALNSLAAAQREWNKISAAAPKLFKDKSPDIIEADVKGQNFYRLRVDGFENTLDAAQFCSEVSAAGFACTVADF